MRRTVDLFHPSTNRLRVWLDTGAPEGVGTHVEQCERCAAKLEDIAESAATDLDEIGSFQAALTALLEPPDDLSERVARGVVQRQHADRELSLLVGLFSIGVETTQLMIDPEAATVMDQPKGHTS